jgi:hypothetical protein
LPGNLLVWNADTYEVLRRDDRPFLRHFIVAPLPGGRLLTGDFYGIRRWTPRRTASEPVSDTNRSKDPVDLVALVGQEPHKSQGYWEVRDSKLFSPTTHAAFLQIPYSPPPAYRIAMKVELVGKLSDRTMGLGLVVDNRQTQIVIDKALPATGRLSNSLDQKGRYSGLNDVDGVPMPFGPNPHHGQLLIASRPVQIEVTVRPGSVEMTCDGVRVVDWNGDPRQLIRNVHWNLAGSKSLFLTSNTSVVIHQMTLTPLPARPS